MRVTLFELFHLRAVLIFESAHFPGMHRVHNVSNCYATARLFTGNPKYFFPSKFCA